MKDNAQYMNAVRTPKHPLVAHAWWNKCTYRHGMLHMLDHHGVANWVIGGILYNHISGERECDVIPGNNIEDRLDFLSAEIATFYKLRKVTNKLPKLGLTNLKMDDGPNLSENGV